MRFPMYSPIHPSITLFKHPSIPHPSFHSLISPPIYLPIYSYAHHLTKFIYPFINSSIPSLVIIHQHIHSSTMGAINPFIHPQSIPYPPVHLSVIHLAIHESIYPLYTLLSIHPFIHPLSKIFPSISIYPLSIQPPIHSSIILLPIHSSTHLSFIYLFIHVAIIHQSSIHPSTNLPSINHSSTHTFIHRTCHPSIHSFTYSLSIHHLSILLPIHS